MQVSYFRYEFDQGGVVHHLSTVQSGTPDGPVKLTYVYNEQEFTVSNVVHGNVWQENRYCVAQAIADGQMSNI